MSEAEEVYLRLKALFAGTRRAGGGRSRTAKKDGQSVPFGVGRDPHGLGDVLTALTQTLGWDSSLARSDLLLSWPDLVGPETAAHCDPIGIDDGVLTVQCASTGWATQLRLMRNDLLAHIARRFPGAGITGIRFQGPDVPSWKRGRRSIPGRGPRDTYG